MGWVRFFLSGVIEQASNNLTLVREIISLYEAKKRELTELLRSDQSIHLLDFLFDAPVFHAPDVHLALNIKRQRAAGYIRQFIGTGDLREIRPASGQRGATLSFEVGVPPTWANDGCSPVSTLLGVSALYHPDIMLELEVTAVG